VKSIRTPALFLSLVALVPGNGGFCQSPPSSETRSIPELIKQLSTEKYSDRERAQQLLLSRRDAGPYLHRAMRTLNAEGQARARAILQQFVAGEMKRFLQYARDGRMDLFLAWSETVGNRLEPKAFWQSLLGLSWNLVGSTIPAEKAEKWATGAFPPRRFEKFGERQVCPDEFGEMSRVTIRPQELQKLILRAGWATAEPIRSSENEDRNILFSGLAFVSGELQIRDSASDSILFGTSNVKITQGKRLLIVADGDVVINRADEVIVVARGDVTLGVSNGNYDYCVSAGQRIKVRAPEIDGIRLRSGSNDLLLRGPPKGAWDETSIKRIRFFELSDIGLEVKSTSGQLLVTGIEANSPMAKAGVKVGDVIVAISGNSVTDAESFRRQLRREFIFGGGDMDIRRDGMVRDLDSSFVGWELPSKRANEAK
jgi:hypothetical protein